MDLESLKTRTAEIRSHHIGKRYVQWPIDFKKEVVKVLDSGFSAKEMADALKISFPTVFSWEKKFSSKSKVPSFKLVSIIEDQKSTIELN